MKTIKLLTLLLCASVFAFAQAPELLNYQGVARNASGQPLANQSITLRLVIRHSTATGTQQYRERHNITTNDYGLYNVAIGNGTIEVGTMGAITWGSGAKYLQVQIDPTGGTSYTNLGTKRILSAPYALSGGTQTRITGISPPGCQSISSASTSYTKIADLGTFTKNGTQTFIELCFQSTFRVGSMTASGVYYELRIDNNPTTLGKANLLLREDGINTPGSISGVFTGLNAGTHTVSIWAKKANGNATSVYYDSGCFSDGRSLIVKEMR